ncbi:MAG: heme oxygenase [Mucilaginibacter sp.]|nr:heme oxygenase [Mucilaginibacter sp.]
MNDQIKKIQDTIEPLRQQVINHKVYSAITSIDDLSVFMNYHIYAVWDFMSLLKALQQNLTCTTVPWFPVGSANTRYLINEIVTGEESDTDINGARKSHYEMYLEAMQQCGAEPAAFMDFMSALQSTGDLNAAFAVSAIPDAARGFVNYTFEVIASRQPHLQAAVFTFGREDLIPNMFHSIVNDLNSKFPTQVSLFKYYLDRHIEVDGDHHSHLALQMTAELCGTDIQKWDEITAASIIALQKRIALWDGIYEEIISKRVLEESSVTAEKLA